MLRLHVFVRNNIVSRLEYLCANMRMPIRNVLLIKSLESAVGTVRTLCHRHIECWYLLAVDLKVDIMYVELYVYSIQYSL